MIHLSKGFQTALWIWLAGSATLLIAYGILLWPQQKRLTDLYRLEQESRQHFEKLQLAHSPAYQQRVRTELQRLQQQYDALCFSSDQLSRLDFRIHDLATQSRVKNFSSKNESGKIDKHLTNLKLTDQRKLVVVLDTDFSSFLRLVNALERNQPALFVHQVVLSKSFFEEDELPTGKIEFSALFAKVPKQETPTELQ